MDVKWIAAPATLAAALLAGAVFFGLALLGNEWLLRNDESAPDDPDWTEE